MRDRTDSITSEMGSAPVEVFFGKYCVVTLGPVH
jgi:hypothetical protein